MQSLYVQLQKDCEDISKQAIMLLESYQKNFTITVQKDRGDFATTADDASEQLIIHYVSKKYPDHGFFAEESGKKNIQSDYVWVIDPLDGTKEYARGLEEYNCLIAIEYKGELITAVIRRHGTNDLYSMSLGNGATHNGNPMHVSPQENLDQSFIGYHLPIYSKSFEKSTIDRNFDVLKKLTYTCYRIRGAWDDAKCLGWVARGILEAHIIPAELKNGWYDLASGIAMVTEAGGKVTDLQGNQIRNHDKSHGLLASNGKIHEQLLELINETK